jgi:hypothetical protein
MKLPVEVVGASIKNIGLLMDGNLRRIISIHFGVKMIDGY